MQHCHVAHGLHTQAGSLDANAKQHLHANPNAHVHVRPRTRARTPRSLPGGRPSTSHAFCQPVHALQHQQQPAPKHSRSDQSILITLNSPLPLTQAPTTPPANRIICAVRTAAALTAAVLLTPAAARAHVHANKCTSVSPACATVAQQRRDSSQQSSGSEQQSSQQSDTALEHSLEDELQQEQHFARSLSHSHASTSSSTATPHPINSTTQAPHSQPAANLASRAALSTLTARSALLASISSSMSLPAPHHCPPSAHNHHHHHTTVPSAAPTFADQPPSAATSLSHSHHDSLHTSTPSHQQARPHSSTHQPQPSQRSPSSYNPLATTAAAHTTPHPQHFYRSHSSHNPLASTAAADAAPHAQQPPLPHFVSPNDATSATSNADPGAAPQQQQQPAPAPPPDGAMLLTQMDAAVHRLFRSAQPSVVNVSGARMATAFSTLDVTRPAPGQGSGFIWDGRGHVVTPYSLVRGAAEVKVTLVDASSYTARVVGWDAGKDVAVLRLSMPKSRLKELRPAKLPVAPISAAGVAGAVSGLGTTPEGLFVGQTVFGVGNMTGLDHTLTKGCVSGLGRELPGSSTSPAGVPLKGLIQIDAPCAHQSGGVLLNAQGHVVGMVANSLGSGSRPAGCGLGYAVPTEAFRGLVDQIIAAPVNLGVGTARPSRPTLGVTLAPPQVLSALGQEGVLVLEVPPGSPGVAAGLRHTHRDIFGDVILGDVICGLDGKSVRNSADLFSALDGRRAGDRVRLDILRDSRATSLTVVLGERGAAGQLEE